MSTLRDQVREFHAAMGCQTPTTPTVPPDDRVRLRARLNLEEAVTEFFGACFAFDNSAYGDALWRMFARAVEDLELFIDLATVRAWSGWPEGTIALDDVTLIEPCSDEAHERHVSEWLDKRPAPVPGVRIDHRVSYVRRLYRPEEYRRLESETRRKRIADLETELARLRAEDAKP